MPTTDTLLDRLAIRELIDNWAMWRDTGRWDDFRACWHAEGVMMATWFQGTFEEFIAGNDEGWKRGVRILHFLGGSSIDVADNRAIAQTKMTISQRAPVDGVICDVVCTGRFYDFFEKRNGRWGLVLKRLVYEKDRLDPVDPAAKLSLDQDLLKSFPEGYRHLAYLQSLIGLTVNKNLPGTRGPRIEALQERGRRWLAGDDPACLDLSWIAT